MFYHLFFTRIPKKWRKKKGWSLKIKKKKSRFLFLEFHYKLMYLFKICKNYCREIGRKQT